MVVVVIVVLVSVVVVLLVVRDSDVVGDRNVVGGGGGGGGDGVGGGGVDDPLAPYARIAAETWNDEGLEELLHSSRREGYLDLRRFRKPGWPRPLRVTRLEASHGKRCEYDEWVCFG